MTLDAFHQHEALHTSHVLMSTWAEHIVDHSYIQTHPELLLLAEKAHGAMMEVYQAIGAHQTIAARSDAGEAT